MSHPVTPVTPYYPIKSCHPVTPVTPCYPIKSCHPVTPCTLSNPVTPCTLSNPVTLSHPVHYQILSHLSHPVHYQILSPCHTLSHPVTPCHTLPHSSQCLQTSFVFQSVPRIFPKSPSAPPDGKCGAASVKHAPLETAPEAL